MHGLIGYFQYLTVKKDSLFLQHIICFKELLLMKIFEKSSILLVFSVWYNKN